ncbi:MAG: PQQ-binding-like beta-propeller repeat protein [bacterium]|nr:PQQ-binding-like beta-propeller repeat protein [bacterium]
MTTISPTGGKPPALVNADDELASYLAGARKNIKEGNYDRAIEVLQALIEKPDSGFVASGDGKQYVALWYSASEVLASMGPEGMGLYRRLYNSQAAKLFAQANATQDTYALRRLTQQFLHTTSGYKALYRLGDLYFDRGQFARAAMYWKRALRLKGVADDKPVLLAKVASALHLSGDASGSKSISDTLHKDHRGATGVMSGKKQDLAAFVDQVRKIPVPNMVASGYKADKEWSGLGAFPSGQAIMGDCDVVLTPSWRMPDGVPIGPVDIRGKMIAMQSLLSGYGSSGYLMQAKPRKGHVRISMSRRQGRGNSSTNKFFMPAGIQPVVAGDVVLCRLDKGVVAYDINTGGNTAGEPLWSTQFSPMYRKGYGTGRRYYGGNTQKVSDNGRYAMTVDGDMLYLLAKFAPKKLSPRFGGRAIANPYSDTSVMQAMSISRAGRLMWQSNDKTVNNDDAILGGKFISVPTVYNGRIYSLLTFRSMYHLVCLDAKTGKLLWRAAISQVPNMGRNYQMYNQHHLDKGSPVAIAEGMAFVSTNAGVVAAFEAESGSAVWAYQYDSKINRAISSRHGSIIQIAGQPSVNPIIVARGKVITLPADSSTLLMLSVVDGKLSARSPSRYKHRDLSAIDENRVLLSGPGLIVLSTTTGEELYHSGNLEIVGRPAVSNHSVLASGQGELIRMNLKDYSQTSRVFTNSDCLLGNLLCVDGKLIATNTSGICVYLNYEDSIKTATRRIEQSSGGNRLKLIFDRGQLSFNSGKLGHALADFKIINAEAGAGGHTAIGAQVTHWLCRTHVAMGNNAKSTDEMQKHFQQARAVAETLGGDSGQQYVLRCTMRLAKVMELRAVDYHNEAKKLASSDKAGSLRIEAKRYAVLTEAVKLARKIADTYSDKRVPDIRIGSDADIGVRDTEDTPLMLAGIWARQRFIPRILRNHGRKCYSAFDEQAGKMLQQAIVENDSDSMREVAARWPNSLWAAQAMYEAGACLYTKTRDGGGEKNYPLMSQAAAWMDDAVRMSDDPMLAVSSMVGRATIYHSMGMLNSAKSISRNMRRLCRDKGITLSERIEFAGREGSVVEFLRKFEGDKPLPLEPAGSSDSLATPLTEAFAIKGRDVFVVRDQEYQPIRQGSNVLLLDAGKAVWFNTAAKSADEAILWKSGEVVVKLDHTRNYMMVPGYGLIAGFSSDAKTLVLVDRGSGTATGFDIATGKANWRRSFNDNKWGITSPVYMASGDGVLVVIDSAGQPTCIDLATGRKLWKGKVVVRGGRKTCVAPPAIAHGIVAIKSNNYKIVSFFDINTGKLLEKWGEGSSSTDGRITDDGLILVRVDGVISLYDPAQIKKGQPIWARKYDSSSKPTLLTTNAGRLFVSEGTYSQWIDVLSINSGNQITRVKVTSFNDGTTAIVGAVARAGDLYVLYGGTISGNLYQYFGRQSMIKGLALQKMDLTDGRVVWSNEIGGENYIFYTLPFTVTDRTVMVVPKPQQPIPRKIFLINSEHGRNLQSIDIYKGLAGARTSADKLKLNAIFQPALIKGRVLVEAFDGVRVYRQK